MKHAAVDYDGFARQLMLDDPSIKEMIQKNDEEYAAVKALMFHYTLITGLIGNTFSYEDRWCYENREKALEAMHEWSDRGFEGEPVGWHRHPATGRRRVGGDPMTEYINP
ncbi:MAG: hypothetical protein ACTHJR_06430 [Sphingomonas sp.]|uniref:hypothetical protein n=1 Tax=Sphingomonas sp. TaxID=28214 RepID=UPI003F7CD570